MISLSSSAPTGDTPAAFEARQDSAFAALSRGYAGLFDSAYLRLTAATSSLGEDLEEAGCASMPSMCGIETSIRMTSGRSVDA